MTGAQFEIRNISLIISFLIAPAKACPTSSAMLKSRNIARPGDDSAEVPHDL